MDSPMDTRIKKWLEDNNLLVDPRGNQWIINSKRHYAVKRFCKRVYERAKKVPAGAPLESAIPASFTKGEKEESDILCDHPEFLPELAMIALDYYRLNQQINKLQSDYSHGKNSFTPVP